MAGIQKVLVTGITGKQGGAVAKVLYEKGHKVRGLTRNPDSERARQLVNEGFEIVEGDFTKPKTLKPAFAGVDTVFAMSTPFEGGMDAEIAQGIAVADAADEAGAFLVYTSVAGANLDTGIPHFDSKFVVEQYIQKLGVPHTIIAPVYFMENLYFPQTKEALGQGTYAVPLPADLALQQVALADIGRFAALAIERREEFEGRRIEIASDTVTGAQEAAELSRALGRKVSYFQVPLEQVRAMSDDMAIMYEWFVEHGYKVDTAGLRKRYPEVGWHSFKTWVAEQNLN